MLPGKRFLTSVLMGNSAASTKASTIPLQAFDGIAGEKLLKGVAAYFLTLHRIKRLLQAFG